MNRGFLKFTARVALVFSLFMVLDGLSGWLLGGMLSKISNQGDTGKTYYALNDVNTPIVVVGSSRASHHYVSSLLEDSLGLPVYNVGRDGCFFSYNCAVIHSILDRYAPRLIIWENGSDYLFDKERDPLESLYPYYTTNNHVHQILAEEVGWGDRVRLSSNLYQYNSAVHRIAVRYLSRASFVDETIKGYFPLSPKALMKPLELKRAELKVSAISPLKQRRMEWVLKRADSLGVEVIVVDSPVFRKVDSVHNASRQMIEKLCFNDGAAFLDNRNLPEFLEHSEYFNDELHLNDLGAQAYTKVFIEQIKDRINTRALQHPNESNDDL